MIATSVVGRSSVESGRRAPRVLIVQYSANRDGSAISGLIGANGLRAEGWETHVAFGFEGAIVADYAEAGHEVYRVPHSNWLRSSRHHRFLRRVHSERRGARAFANLMIELAPDLVYVNSLVSLAGAVAAKRREIPVIWHIRELFQDVGGEMRVPRGLRWWVRRTIRRNARILVANSDSVAENVLGRNSGAEVVPNAVPDDFFATGLSASAARAAYGLPVAGPVVGVPGTLRPVKGHSFLFRAVRGLARRRPDLTLAVTGDASSEYAASLRQVAHEAGIERQTRFLGAVTDMPTFYRACSIVCIPSRAEPFGRTVIEAFATGVPVVATAVGGIREIVRHDETGLLVSFGDEEGLAGSIERMLDDEGLRERLVRNARRRATDEYRESVYRARICRLAASAVAGRSLAVREPASA